MEELKKIAILTSGGDAPGMNSCIRAITRCALLKGYEVYGVRDGYLGLVENRIEKMERSSVTNISYLGGTILGSARLPEFAQDEVAARGAENLRKLGIHSLIVIGGDGSYRGALKLDKLGIKVIGIPGTIDNDIASTEYTIGFDTAVNTAVTAMDCLRDTCNSHARCSILEVMGRYCGDISYAVGIASGSDMIINADTGFDLEKVLTYIKGAKAAHHSHVLICIAEHVTDVRELAKTIEKETGFVSRATILGHIQRGGRPSPFDRILATRFGVAAVEGIEDGKSGVCIGIFNNQINYFNIEDALKMEKHIFKDYAIHVNDSSR